MSVVRVEQVKQEWIQVEEKFAMSAPLTGIDWLLELRKPWTEAHRRYVNILRSIITEDDEHELLLERIAYFTHTRQKFVEEQIRRELDYEYDLQRDRQMKAYAESQFRDIPMGHPSREKNSIQDTISELLRQASILVFQLSTLKTEQNQLHYQWQKRHRAHAKQVINRILADQINLLDHEGKSVDFNVLKQEQIMQALMPATPALVCKVMPTLQDKIIRADVPNAVNPVCAQMAKINDTMGELRFNSLMHNHQDAEHRLMGKDLLNAVKNNRVLLRGAGVMFAATDTTTAKLIRQDVELTAKMAKISGALDKIDERAKEKLQHLRHFGLFAQKPNHPMDTRKRPNPFNTDSPFRTRPRFAG